MAHQPNILIADDEDGIRFTLQEVLKSEGVAIHTATNGEEALERVRETDFDLAILDYKMPKMNGIDALKQIKKLQPQLPVLLMTAFGSRDLALDALRQGAYDYFNKPFEIDELRIVVRRALEKEQMRRQIEQLQNRLDDDSRFDKIIGSSEQIQEIFTMLKRVAASDATVMITGESGTGKELIAQAIHFHSVRRDCEFVSINCAAIPENLLESELFGHERGAFTGAVSAKPGRFEVAQNGTIFLDEIGDMPMALQAKMLRVLQERCIERVGGSKSIPVDVRVLAATHQNLADMVKEGTFREDLFFRLNVVPVELPPLRRRGNDILLLAEHFLKHYSQKFNRPEKRMTDEAIEWMSAYTWPGNVRELENVIQRAVILSTGGEIGIDDLPGGGISEPEKSGLHMALPDTKDFSVPLQEKINAITERYETEYIKEALQEAGSHRQGTADLLGISRKSLHNKMQKYGLFSTEPSSDTPGEETGDK